MHNTHTHAQQPKIDTKDQIMICIHPQQKMVSDCLAFCLMSDFQLNVLSNNSENGGSFFMLFFFFI